MSNAPAKSDKLKSGVLRLVSSTVTMHPEHTYHLTPCCPSCGAAMRFVRSIPKIDVLAELQTFECRAYGVSITEAFEPKVLEMVAL